MVWFDVALSLPLGLALDDSARGDAVGVTSVLDGGSVAAHNDKHLLETDPRVARNWVQQGDRLITVNGKPCNSKADAVELITSAPDPENIRMKFSRERTGFIQVVFPEKDFKMAVRPRILLSKVAEEAGITFSNGDGSSWYVNDRTQELYNLCDDILVGELPSRNRPSDGLGGLNPFKEIQMQDFVDPDDVALGFGNTEPLVLRSCPELYQRALEQQRRRQSEA
uniref:PDZ domain-containing protein n=1 Tax=Alexandrium andersonii TaxID=327968 RepID=A0A7S2CPH2_9DINO|mmetsp:Transcript_41557/g.94454  ORF Transcript_41557/g.94454 Transcript_41557/m.94454 type:complete len:224 (+) Transcript_41557:1-672(+)